MKRTVLLCSALVGALACNDEVTGLGPPSDPATETFAPALGIDIAQMTRLPAGTYVQNVVLGTGDSVWARTDSVWVTYAGFLKDGTEFDSGINVKFQPAFLAVAGFRDGIAGMRVGGRRKIVVPSAQGYGGQSVKGPDGKIEIPRQSTLVFTVELLRVHNVEEEPDAALRASTPSN